jgi:hypothetical protein
MMRGCIHQIFATESFGLTLSLSFKDPSVNKLDLLFDSKEFAVVFRAAVGASSSVCQMRRPDAAACSQGDAASVDAEYSHDNGQMRVNDVQIGRKEK